MNANPTALAGHTDPEPATSEPPVAVTVPVVDDSPMDRHVAGAIVQKLPGWKVAFAANGVEALAAVDRVLLGFELAHELTVEVEAFGHARQRRADFFQ